MSARFLVRTSYSEYGPDLHRIYDTLDKRWIETFAQQQLAERAAERLNLGWRARLSIVPTPVPADPPGGGA